MKKNNKMLSLEQLHKRKNGIGGSDAAAICGLSKYKTPLKVYLDKISEHVTHEDNPVFDRGHTLEPFIREIVSRKSGKHICVKDETIYHPSFPFMYANVDGVLQEGGIDKAIIEIKTSNVRANNFELGIPDDYFLQVQHYMSVCGLKYSHLVVLIADESYFKFLTSFIKKNGIDEALKQDLNLIDALNIKVFDILRDDEVIERLIEIEKDFWSNHVEKRIPPSYETIGDIKLLFPKSNSKTMIAAGESLSLFQRRSYLSRHMKFLNDYYSNRIEELDKEIMSFMEDCEKVVDSNGKILVSWKNSTRNSIDVTKLKIEMPEMYEKFTRQSESRVFKVFEK